MVQAGEPGLRHVVGAGPARALRAVARKGEPCFLAQRVQPVPGAVRPVGVRLAREQLGVVRERGARASSLASLAGGQARRAARHPFVGVDREPGESQRCVRSAPSSAGPARRAPRARYGPWTAPWTASGPRRSAQAAGTAPRRPGRGSPGGRADKEQRAEPPCARARPRPTTRSPAVMANWPSSLTRTACPAGASCVIPATTPPLSRARYDILRPDFSGRPRRVPRGRARCRSGRARRREHRGNSAFLTCVTGGRNDEHLVLDLSGRAATSAAEQREADVPAGELAAAVTRLGRSAAAPGHQAPGDGTPGHQASEPADAGDCLMQHPLSPVTRGWLATTWRGRLPAMAVNGKVSMRAVSCRRRFREIS